MKKGIVLLSGGFDSPVAAHLMLEKGYDLVFAHCYNNPYADDRELDKCRLVIQYFAKKYNKAFKFYIIPHGKDLTAIMKETTRGLTCLFCRRMMYRLAAGVAKLEKADFLVSGENLGQVASQTLDNLSAIDPSVDIEVIRPLLTYNKNEIIKIAREIGTYDISVMPSMCCTATPRNPATRAKLHFVEKEEGRRLDVKEMTSTALDNLEVSMIDAYTTF
ncbi:MAG: hypothetical protein GOV15_00230 [Candidatus Diapherotrites archaeon]|nr:hypothetical protein [Candidatus Diapherotrites archaeon]